ncbi:MAG TPA: hypothetical protein VGD62_10895, partial [Acidobacteriaceae bacterium]
MTHHSRGLAIRSALFLTSLCPLLAPTVAAAQHTPQVHPLAPAQRSLEFKLRPASGYTFPVYESGYLLERT